jgi:hypothetical protein
MSHYTVDQLRQRRLARRVEPLKGELNRLNWERQQLREEYVRVAGIYAGHLERIKKKAKKNNNAMQALHGLVAQLGATAGPDSLPAVTQET